MSDEETKRSFNNLLQAHDNVVRAVEECIVNYERNMKLILDHVAEEAKSLTLLYRGGCDVGAQVPEQQKAEEQPKPPQTLAEQPLPPKTPAEQPKSVGQPKPPPRKPVEQPPLHKKPAEQSKPPQKPTEQSKPPQKPTEQSKPPQKPSEQPPKVTPQKNPKVTKPPPRRQPSRPPFRRPRIEMVDDDWDEENVRNGAEQRKFSNEIVYFKT